MFDDPQTLHQGKIGIVSWRVESSKLVPGRFLVSARVMHSYSDVTSGTEEEAVELAKSFAQDIVNLVNLSSTLFKILPPGARA